MDNNIQNRTDIEIDGQIYLIPNKLTDKLKYSTYSEHITLYKYLIAMVLHLNYSNYSYSKKIFEKVLSSVDKIFAYLITGKINDCDFTPIEKTIIDKIPKCIIPEINPNIIEKFEVFDN